MIRSKSLLHFFLLTVFITCSACSQMSGASPSAAEQRFTYHEFDGINILYRTDDLTAYRRLLPKMFDMPKEPMVRAFIMDYYKMDANTQPYQEAALFLLAEYEGQPIWHCITMPVTDDDARKGGIYYLGYPKIMGDVNLHRNESHFTGEFKLNQKSIMTLNFETEDRTVTTEEQQMFEWLPGIKNLNILNGKIYEPKFGSNPGRKKPSLLKVAAMMPDKFQIRVGKATVAMDAQAAGSQSKRLGEVFSIQPTQIVLAYYIQNKIVMKFGQ